MKDENNQEYLFKLIAFCQDYFNNQTQDITIKEAMMK